MTKIVMIRHGEPDYSYFDDEVYAGFGKEFGPLSKQGIQQAKQVALDPRLDGAQLIVSSPFTRSLHTAALIAKERGLEIEIQPGLHEWIPQRPYRFTCDEDYIQPNQDFIRYEGEMDPTGKYNYETLQELFDRAYPALLPYLKYDKIIVVAHGVLMRAFEYRCDIPYCGIITFDFDETRVLKDNGRNRT
ncbi:MAG: phosphoglycerate mutase family protein [Erysipelotrichaceae bacterium]|nr:phosphoglycerate mutase family protein [Erysipelotrichaceae bacterium]